MKKLIVVMAAIAIASAMQASTVDWKLTTGGTTYAGMTAYAFTATDLATTTALDACKSTTASDWTKFFATGDKGTNTGSGNRLTAQASTEGIAAGDSLTFVIVDGDVAEGANYYVFSGTAIPAANVYDPPATVTAWNPKASNLTLAGSGTFTAGSTPTPGPGPIPEPTSGLLLLVGGAMLALRRKQK